jgi:hypothetical protein
MIELTGCFHMHTAYSDGELYHAELADAAARAGLDFIIVTDHNIYVSGVDRWIAYPGGRRVLVLAGEEIHHQDRIPQKNHLLVAGAQTELSRHARDPQALLDSVRSAGGAAFLAHPYDPAAPLVREEALGWVAWDAIGYSGLEIWNYMSEFKSLFHNRWEMIGYAFFPSLGIRGPNEQTLEQWDRLLAQGRRVAAVGGPDAHGHSYSLGPLRKQVFTYEYLFRAVRIHMLVDSVSGDADADGRAIVAAMKTGRGWVAYDLPKSSKGFRYSAQGSTGVAGPGDALPFSAGIVLKGELPAPAEWRIIRAGAGIVGQGSGSRAVFSPVHPGAYRLEAYRRYRGRRVGWIFSNPIYLTESPAGKA